MSVIRIYRHILGVIDRSIIIVFLVLVKVT